MQKNEKERVKFADKLEEILAAEGKKAHELTKQGILPSSTLTDYHKGRTEPNYSKIQDCSDFFDISPGYFFSSLTPERYRVLTNCADVFNDMQKLTEVEKAIVFDLMKGQTFYLDSKRTIQNNKLI